MATFRTVVNIPPADFKVTHKDPLLSLGSCFAMETGGRLQSAGFSVVLNPFGILYNPISLSAGLKLICNTQLSLDEGSLFNHNGLWHSPIHHGSFSHVEKESALVGMNEALEAGREQFQRSNFILLTLGTSQVFRSKKSGEIVANNHKLPKENFTEEQLTTKQIIANFESTFQLLFEKRPELRIILTVSPIRHRRNGFQQNQLSKARLLLAADALRQNFPDRVSYFPAYEILLDELRDYRFYASDMLHPNETATNYIWEKFCQCYFDKATQQLATEIEKLKKSLKHRPLFPESAAHTDFLKQTWTRIETLAGENPAIDFSTELKQIEEALGKI